MQNRQIVNLFKGLSTVISCLEITTNTRIIEPDERSELQKEIPISMLSFVWNCLLKLFIKVKPLTLLYTLVVVILLFLLMSLLSLSVNNFVRSFVYVISSNSLTDITATLPVLWLRWTITSAVNLPEFTAK